MGFDCISPSSLLYFTCHVFAFRYVSFNIERMNLSRKMSLYAQLFPGV